jgi:hypothetical protein
MKVVDFVGAVYHTPVFYKMRLFFGGGESIKSDLSIK